MANKVKSNTQIVNQIFDDLDNLRNFCRDYGYRFDERDLYNSRSNVYRLYQRHASGKQVRNQWEVDLAAFKEQELTKTRV